MMSQNNRSPLRPLGVVFIFTLVIIIAAKDLLTKWGVNTTVVSIGNLILALVTIGTFILTHRSLKAENPNVFVRTMYSNFMIKLFVCVVAAFIYFIAAKPNINKPALIVCMGLYILYTTVEVSSLTKLLRKQKNG